MSRHVVAACVLVLTALSVSACGATAGVVEGTEQRWGPLAVVPPSEAVAEALIHGALRIADGCVVLDEQGDDVLLVWPADRTTWNARAGTIAFENLDGTTVTVGDGDAVEMGGGGTSAVEGGLPDDEWVASIEWVASPDPSCVTATRWGVGDVFHVASRR